MVRIVWPHHPLYLTAVPLVEFWECYGERSLVIELPDGSHTRIPVSWGDDGDGPPVATATTTTVLSVTAVRELLGLVVRLREHVQA